MSEMIEDDEITTKDQFDKSDMAANIREEIARRRAESAPPAKDSPKDTPPESGAPGDKSKVKPEDEEPVVDDEGSDDDEDQPQKDGSEDTPAISDALVERAIRAGMSYTEVKSFTSASLMESMVSKLEATKTAVAGKPEDDKKGEPEGEKDPLDALGDLDPEEYDPALVEQLKGIKGIVKSISEENKALKAELQARGDSQGTWVDGEIANLGKDFEDVFGSGNVANMGNGQQKAARDKLTRHIEFLKSEAKLEGKEMSNADAFKAALAAGFADKLKSTKGAAAQRAAAERSRRTLARPRDTTGRFSPQGSGPDGQMTMEDRRAKAAATVRSMMVEEE